MDADGKTSTFDFHPKLEMMKKTVLMLFVGLLSVGVFAQEEQEELAKAKIEFKTETIDFGKVERGGDGVRTFEFTNTGRVPLVISDVKSSCGCTIPKKPEAPVMPGETGVIEVKYDTKRPVGPFRKVITVTSNTDTETTLLKIKGELVEGTE